MQGQDKDKLEAFRKASAARYSFLRSLAQMPPDPRDDLRYELAMAKRGEALERSARLLAEITMARMASGGGMERRATTKKSIRPVRGKGGRHRVPREKSKAYHWANEVKKVLPNFREGYKLLTQFKAAYPAQEAVWVRELSRRGYLPLHIEALIESKTPGAAACRYVANKNSLKLRAIQNAYSRFK